MLTSIPIESGNIVIIHVMCCYMRLGKNIQFLFQMSSKHLIDFFSPSPPVALLVKLVQLSEKSDLKPSNVSLVLEQMPQETFYQKGTLD